MSEPAPSSHTPWPSIENFAHARNTLAKLGRVRVFHKIKLHGTNAAVRIDPDGTVTAQSRNRDVKVGDADTHFGFAQWVADHADDFRKLAGQSTIILYGEWAGPGINTGDACSRIPERTLFLFSMGVCVTDGVGYLSQNIGAYVVETIGDLGGRLRALPPLDSTEVNFADPIETEAYLEKLDALVTAIGERDPYIFETYGIEGPGEGVVVYLATSGLDDTDDRPLFKVKVDGHGKGTKAPKPTRQPRDVAKVANAQDFAKVAVTEERLHQGLRETGATTRKDTGDFMRWVNADVQKECAQELALAGLEWSDVAQAVQKRASAWYLAHVACA